MTLSRSTLPNHTQEELAKILSFEPQALNEEQLAFLKARRFYLTEIELEKYFPDGIDEDKKSDKKDEDKKDEDKKDDDKSTKAKGKQIGK